MASGFMTTTLRSLEGTPAQEKPKQLALPRHPVTEANAQALELARSIQVQNTLENEWGRYRYEGVGLE
jgi:hypothetical protein